MEAQRQLLEELNVLEVAATQRFRKNPALSGPGGITEPDEVLELKPKRPHRETLLHEHELDFFQNQYILDSERCRSAFSSEKLSREISLMTDPEMKFQTILSTIQDIDAKYMGVDPGNASSMRHDFSMYLSAPTNDVLASSKPAKVKRKYHLSTATQHIDRKLKQAFSESEVFGKCVNLTLFHEMYKSLLGSNQSYVDYLQLFLTFEGCNKTLDYIRYLDGLLSYLKNFYQNAFPLTSGDSDDNRPADTETTTTNDDEKVNGKANANGEVYCKPCDKLFAKTSVYIAHLSGKKHKKNEQSESTCLKSETTTSYKSLEDRIRAVAVKLNPIIHSTINDCQRRSRFSDREQQLERVAIEGELSDFTSIDSGSSAERSDDDDLEDAYSKDLPLGADGIPIPLWLYKLQGLHRTYPCEVCGNISYKGRQQFNKHFGLPKHLHGLRCLGVRVQDTALFSSISTISGVEELLETVEMTHRTNEEDDENTVEVEDDEGNVMSRKDYDELKKQGLI